MKRYNCQNEYCTTIYHGECNINSRRSGVIIYTNTGLDPLTMMDWYYHMDNDDSLYLYGCQSNRQRHA